MSGGILGSDFVVDSTQKWRQDCLCLLHNSIYIWGKLQNIDMPCAELVREGADTVNNSCNNIVFYYYAMSLKEGGDMT